MNDDDRTYAIIGAAMQVHREMGPGFREATYQKALALELAAAGVPHEREVPVEVWYRRQSLGTFRADFACFGDVLLELKATPFLGKSHVAQLSHHLAASGKPLGLVINFGADSCSSSASCHGGRTSPARRRNLLNPDNLVNPPLSRLPAPAGPSSTPARPLRTPAPPPAGPSIAAARPG